MIETEARNFPDKLPGPDYKMEIDWYYVLLFICGHVGLVYGAFITEKPVLSGIYSEF